MYEQLTLFQPLAPPVRTVYGKGVGQAPALPGRKDSAHMEAIYLDRLLPLEDYGKIIVLFSGGKDSLACVLDLLERKELESMGCRMKFPAKSGSLATRWCSSILKIMVADTVIRNLDLLKQDGQRMKFPAKSSCHQGRWCSGSLKAQVWEIIQRWHIAPHPCYAAGWNRCSCMMCIFSLPGHWAGIRELFPERFAEVKMNVFWALPWTMRNAYQSMLETQRAVSATATRGRCTS